MYAAVGVVRILVVTRQLKNTPSVLTAKPKWHLTELLKRGFMVRQASDLRCDRKVRSLTGEKIGRLYFLEE